MDSDDRLTYLIDALKAYTPDSETLDGITDPRLHLRALMNVTMPYDLPDKFYRVQDELLEEECRNKRLYSIDDMETSTLDKRLLLFKGDITTIRVDAIVNAANSALLGCFRPLHNCIDNIIHSAAGLEVRRDLMKVMKRQGCEEETGKAKITKGYALPSKYIIHTVGPIVTGRRPDENDEALLSSCYASCLKLLTENNLNSIAFPCISTGVFGYPKKDAPKVAVNAVMEFLKEDRTVKHVVFNVFEDEDEEYYRKELGL